MTRGVSYLKEDLGARIISCNTLHIHKAQRRARSEWLWSNLKPDKTREPLCQHFHDAELVNGFSPTWCAAWEDVQCEEFIAISAWNSPIDRQTETFADEIFRLFLNIPVLVLQTS